MIMVIEDCVKDWNNGGYTVKGCTIQFLLDWLWNLHRTYKANGIKICKYSIITNCKKDVYSQFLTKTKIK